MRTIQGVPEGGSLISNPAMYKVVDSPDHDELGEGVTREWVITYAPIVEHWSDSIFIVHAKTISEAFDHFIDIKPNTYVKGIEYYGIYF